MPHRNTSFNKGAFTNLTTASSLAVLQKPAESHGLLNGNAYTQFSLFLVSLLFCFMPVGISKRNPLPFTTLILVIRIILKCFAIMRRSCPEPYKPLHFSSPFWCWPMAWIDPSRMIIDNSLERNIIIFRLWFFPWSILLFPPEDRVVCRLCWV